MKIYKILYTSAFADLKGGGQKSLLLLLDRLDRKKIFPILLCPSDGELIEKARKLGIETIIFKMGSLKSLNFISMLTHICKLRTIMKQKKVDLIHTDAPRQTFYAGLVARLTRIPLIWHVRVSDPERKIYEKFIFFLSTKVIAVSKAVKKRFERLKHCSDKVTIIYNGVDLSEFGFNQPGERLSKEFGIEDDWTLVGTVGQFIPGKGQNVFLEAASQISNLIPKVKFIIVGNGNESYRKKLQDLSKRLRIEKKVILTGFRHDIPQIMNSLDIVVLPSSNLEGFSRVILEAMASSKPVIATEGGGNSEAVEDGKTGILVPSGDVRKLAKAILELVKDENKRRQMGIAGRERVEKLFSIERNVAQIEKLYEDLLCQDI